MKLQILSDLHLSVSAMDPPATDADAVVLAGDIARPREAVAFALRLGKPVLYVPGNHEYYGGSLAGVRAELARLCAGTAVRLLDNGETSIDGVRFLGSTLWTDFALDGDGAARVAAERHALRAMRDFSRIRIDDAADAALFSPADAAALFARDAAWLQGRLAQPHDGPTVVISHHAPSPRSVHARFAGSPINACFASRAEHLLGGARVRLWIHGHTHDSFDYEVAGTRVLCNPRGYVKDGVDENPHFDPRRVVEL